MPNQKQLNKNLQYSLKNVAKDSDRDGVPNAIDCNPDDPNKQGWVHDKWEQLKQKAQNRRTVSALKREERYEREKPMREARETERQKQAIETARYKERIKGKRQRSQIKSGSGQFSNALAALSGAVTTTMPRKKTTRQASGGMNTFLGTGKVTGGEMNQMLGSTQKKKLKI